MNQAKPGVKVILDKERELRFDLNAMAAFEELTGKRLFDGSFVGVAGMSTTDIRAMLWACLHAELTLEQVGELVMVSNLPDILAALNKAFEVSLPKPSGKKAARPLAAAAP